MGREEPVIVHPLAIKREAVRAEEWLNTSVNLMNRPMLSLWVRVAKRSVPPEAPVRLGILYLLPVAPEADLKRAVPAVPAVVV